MSSRSPGALLPLLGVVAAGLLWEGCAERAPARLALPGQASDLQVTDASSVGIHVSVDGLEVGILSPGQTVGFQVDPGSRTVAFRPQGSPILEGQGTFQFDGGARVALTYDPGQPVNLEVTNHAARSVHVFVDTTEVGTTGPGGTAGWKVPTGTRQVSFREDGQALATPSGSFDINTSGVLRLSYP